MDKPKRGSKDTAVAGHKCKGARLYVSIHCECGWTSGKWGAAHRSSAYAEWRWHVDQHRKSGACAPGGLDD